MGAELALGDKAFDSVRFTAQADAYQFQDFSDSAGGGATFTVVAVPEPQTYALWLAGLARVVAVARRQRGAGAR